MDNSGLVFDALESFGLKISTRLYGMIPVNDQYGRPPYLRFRFKDKAKEDKVYKQITDVVNTFKGNLEWIMTTREDSPDYVILPKLFLDSLLSMNIGNIDYHIAHWTETRYKRTCRCCNL